MFKRVCAANSDAQGRLETLWEYLGDASVQTASSQWRAVGDDVSRFCGSERYNLNEELSMSPAEASREVAQLFPSQLWAQVSFVESIFIFHFIFIFVSMVTFGLSLAG